MKFHLKIVIFTIIAVGICCLILPADSEEHRHKRRHNHHRCNKWKPQPECNEPKCNEGPYDAEILIYPAAGWFYNEFYPEYVPELIELKKGCCYNLTGDYDETTSGVQSNNICFKLYADYGCTGVSLTIPSGVTTECEKFIDCGELLGTATDGLAFNDRASSVRLC